MAGASRAKRRASDDGVTTSSSTSISNKRTGQACIRCKDRKIKCDTRDGKCGPCEAANESCQAIDRNTGQIYTRGQQTDTLAVINERDEYIRKLQDQLTSAGLKPIDRNVSNVGDGSFSTATIAAFDRTYVGRNYLGAAGHPSLSMLQGSQMTIFGNLFDLDRYFTPSERNAAFELSEKEYRNYSVGSVVARPPPCPPQKEAKEMANLFFNGTAWFTPVVDRPAFYALIDRQYNRGPALDHTETVIFHMVMSIAEFQTAVRSRAQSYDVGLTAKARLLFCLTNVSNLLQDEALAAMQALTLICMAMRNLQRPGPAWIFCDQVLARATELGLHRSLSAWQQQDETQQDHSHHEQMRQRIFWTIMVVYVNISGNLGRPMRLRYEDIDIEIPKCTPDPLLGENPETCTWEPSQYGFRLTAIMLEVYSTICAIRQSPAGSRKDAHHLNEQLNQLENSLPPRYKKMEPSSPGIYIAGLYLRLGIHATRLIVWHPRHLRAPNFENSSHQQGILLSSSKTILDIAEELTTYQSLDTTVYYNMDFVYAAFVSLFVTRQRARRKDRDTNLDDVRNDMIRWLRVFQAIGDMLGTGSALSNNIHRISEIVLQEAKTELEKQDPASMSPSVTVSDAVPDGADVILQHPSAMGSHFYASTPPILGPGMQMDAEVARDSYNTQTQGLVDYDVQSRMSVYSHGSEHYGAYDRHIGLQAPQHNYYGARPWQNHMDNLDTERYAPYEGQMAPIMPDLAVNNNNMASGLPDGPAWPNLYHQ